VDDLNHRLRALRAWAGMSYREIHRWVVRTRQARGVQELPSYSTVYRSLQPGRRRPDLELLFDIARVLSGDEDSAAEWKHAYRIAVGQASEAATVEVFNALPEDRADFVGRRSDLESLVRNATSERRSTVLAIEGMAGVGKTRLAIRTGHSLLELEPFDLSLVVNLRGFDDNRAPADPSAVLAGFLRRLGLSGDRIHRLNLAGRMNAYNEMLSDKRAMILLDNAASAGQLRPLLPQGPRCLVIVTSRWQLTTLSATRHALHTFTPQESLALLRRRVGQDRVDAEVDSASRIAQALGYLPLALSLIAGRIQNYPDWSLADHLERLTEELTSPHLDIGLEMSLKLSYDSLPSGQQRMLRRLALHPGTRLDCHTAGVLANEDLEASRLILRGLSLSHLVERHPDARYGMHDLVRRFAVGRGRDEDAPSTRRAALTRLFDQYRGTISQAMDLYAPHEAHRRPHFTSRQGFSREFTDAAVAVRWLESERTNAVAMAIHSTRTHEPRFAIDISNLLHRYLDTTAHHNDAEALHTCAIQVAEGADKARIHNRLGTIHARLGRYRNALDHYQQALAIFREVDDRANVGRTLNNLGIAHQRLGNYDDALALGEEALVHAQESTDQTSLGRTLNNLGLVSLRLGRYADAERKIRRAMVTARKAGNRPGESYARTHLAIVLGRLGRDPEAIEHLRRALELAREVDDKTGESYALSHLGSAYARLGLDSATQHHEVAVSIAHEIGDRETEAEAHNEMGASMSLLGQPRRSLAPHREARSIAADVGDRYQEARSEAGLAVAYEGMAAIRDARTHWNKALELFTDLNTPEADEIQGRLRDLESPTDERADSS
jgi:tetratricopeptide (TPR) repeat protein